MVNEYAKQVIDLVKTTTNSEKDMERVIEAAEAAVNQVDQDIEALMAQRRDVLIIYNRTVTLSEVILEEALRSKGQAMVLSVLPGGAKDTDALREQILEIADKFRGRDGGITEEFIVSRLRRSKIEIPWQNPNAVVATILSRTGQWQKTDKGKFEMIDEED